MQVKQEWVFKAVPKPGMTIEELEEKLLQLGHKIMQRDADGIIVVRETKTQEFLLKEEQND